MTENDKKNLPMALSRFVSLSGAAARRKASELVKKGEIQVNEVTIINPAHKVRAGDKVTYAGEALKCQQKQFHIMLNKPRGYVCTNDDPHAKKTVFDLVALPAIRLFTAGRLDKDSEGLLIITNDGDYSNRLTHPKFGVTKRYKVTVDKELSAEDCKRICSGIKDSGERLRALKIEREKDLVYILTMGEGKKREVRRLLKGVKRKTVRLQRIAIGGLLLKNLQPGQWRFLEEEDIAKSISESTSSKTD